MLPGPPGRVCLSKPEPQVSSSHLSDELSVHEPITSGMVTAVGGRYVTHHVNEQKGTVNEY